MFGLVEIVEIVWIVIFEMFEEFEEFDDEVVVDTFYYDQNGKMC